MGEHYRCPGLSYFIRWFNKNQILYSVSDKHDLVLRFNHAPTVDYEADVGTKTTIRIVNSQVASKPEFDFTTSFLYKNIKILIWDPMPFRGTIKFVSVWSTHAQTTHIYVIMYLVSTTHTMVGVHLFTCTVYYTHILMYLEKNTKALDSRPTITMKSVPGRCDYVPPFLSKSISCRNLQFSWNISTKIVQKVLWA